MVKDKLVPRHLGLVQMLLNGLLYLRHWMPDLALRGYAACFASDLC